MQNSSDAVRADANSTDAVRADANSTDAVRADANNTDAVRAHATHTYYNVSHGSTVWDQTLASLDPRIQCMCMCMYKVLRVTLTAHACADWVAPIVAGAVGLLGALLFKSSSLSHWRNSQEVWVCLQSVFCPCNTCPSVIACRPTTHRLRLI